jgi:hypothetical protein
VAALRLSDSAPRARLGPRGAFPYPLILALARRCSLLCSLSRFSHRAHPAPASLRWPNRRAQSGDRASTVARAPPSSALSSLRETALMSAPSAAGVTTVSWPPVAA